MTSFSQI